MKTNYYIKMLSGTLVLSILYFLYDFTFSSDITLNSIHILWGLISSGLVLVLLSSYVSNSTLRGPKLALSVFVIYYIIGHFNILIEAYIFNITDRVVTLKEMLRGLIVVLIFSPLLVYIFNKWEGNSTLVKSKSRSGFGWIWRVFLGVFLYLIFYLSAGLILQATYPGLMDFYKDKIPTFDVMILTQFPRGFLFILITILIIRTTKLALIKKAVLVGLIFSVLGGIAPLISPNELMPANIRMVHGIEVGISNFLYGFVLVYLLGQKTLKEKPSK